MVKYDNITVNGYGVVFRFRDDNRIKISHIYDGGNFKHDLLENARDVLGIDYDDCNGQEFLKILTHLNTKG